MHRQTLNTWEGASDQDLLLIFRLQMHAWSGVFPMPFLLRDLSKCNHVVAKLASAHVFSCFVHAAGLVHDAKF